MVGAQIKQARIAAKMSQSKLARHCGLDRNTIRKIEAGLSDPKSGTLRLIAEMLGVAPGIFFEESADFEKQVDDDLNQEAV